MTDMVMGAVLIVASVGLGWWWVHHCEGRRKAMGRHPSHGGA